MDIESYRNYLVQDLTRRDNMPWYGDIIVVKSMPGRKSLADLKDSDITAVSQVLAKYVCLTVILTGLRLMLLLSIIFFSFKVY